MVFIHHYKYFLLGLVLLYCSTITLAQTPLFTIKGLAVDSKDKPIDVGNLLVLNPTDSSLIKGTYIMDGFFELEGLSKNSFLLRLTALGYSDTTVLINNDEQKTILDLGKFTLMANNNLATITVEATVPTFKAVRGKVIVNVEKSMLSTSGTALDVLHKSPKIIVNSKDEVTMFGKGAPLLLLNGLPVTAQELKTIPSSEIKEVEIIKNPSARYNADGRSVVNIITKSQNLEGYNGQATLYLTQARYFRAFGSLSFNYKKDKWSFGTSYSYNYRKTWDSNKYIRTYPTTGLDTMTMNNDIESVYSIPNNHYYKVNVGFRPDSVSQLGLQYRGSYSDRSKVVDNNNSVLLNNNNFNSISSTTNGSYQTLNNSANLNYSRTLDTLDSEIFAAVQYSGYTQNGLDNIFQRQMMPVDTLNNNFQNSNDNLINIITAQVDFKKGFANGILYEAGAKNSFIFNDSKIAFREQNSIGEWVTDTSYSSGYNYHENVLAFYTQASWEIKKWFFEAGVRAEWTKMEGFGKKTRSQLVNKDYWHFFPTVSITYNILENLSTSVGYSTSIKRPSFQDLNPFVDFIDQYSSDVGNPNLIPAYTHSAWWDLTFMEMASIEFEFSRTLNYMDIFIDKQGNNFYITTKNYDIVDQYSVGLNIPYENKWWTTYNAFGLNYTNLQYSKGDNFLTYSKPLFYLYLYNAFRIPKVFNVEITFQYVTGGAEGYFDFEPFYQLGASIERKFLDGKLSVRLSVEDILYSYREKGKSLVNQFDIKYTNLYDTRYVRLAVSYNFGKLKAKNIKDRTVDGSERGRIKN
jgi:hypothetical protein